MYLQDRYLVNVLFTFSTLVEQCTVKVEVRHKQCSITKARVVCFVNNRMFCNQVRNSYYTGDLPWTSKAPGLKCCPIFSYLSYLILYLVKCFIWSSIWYLDLSSDRLVPSAMIMSKLIIVVFDTLFGQAIYLIKYLILGFIKYI